MTLFYITGEMEYGSGIGPYTFVITQHLSSEYDSSFIETELGFNRVNSITSSSDIAFFTEEEISTLMKIKNKEIPYGSKLDLRGMNVSHFSDLFSYMEKVEVRQVEIKL